MLEINTIYNEDCLGLMEKLPDNYFDLIVTDPPYGLGIDNHNRADSQWGQSITKCKNYGNFEWDNNKITKRYIDEMIRVSKNTIIFGGNYYANWLNPSSCWIVWDKVTGNNDYADCELAWTSFDKAVRQFKFMWKGMFQEKMNWKEKRVHPTQKPVALGRWILERFAIKGDLIFDPFAGSGSFLLACKQLGYNFVGCEINKDYTNIINERLKQKTLLPLDVNTKEDGFPPTPKGMGIQPTIL